MKRYYFIFAFILCATCASAQECYKHSRSEGIAAYNSGQYDKALKYFNAALTICDDTPANNDVESWVRKCNEAKQKKNTNPVIAPTERKVENKTATLYIASAPSSSFVYINNTYRGLTPLTVSNLPIGQTNIELRNSGYKNDKTTMYLKPGYNSNYILLIKEEDKTATYKPQENKTATYKPQETKSSTGSNNVVITGQAGYLGSNQEIRLGITGGLNICTINNMQGLTSTPGFQAGIVVDFPLSESFSIVPELHFTRLGAMLDESPYSTLILDYVQLPINLTCKFTPNFSIFAGLYAGYGLSGTIETDDEDIEFGFGEGELNRIDFGFNVGLGLQFGEFFARFQVNPGMADITSEGGHHFNAAWTIGFFF